MRTSLSPAAAAALVPDGATVMIGGFMGVGSPHRIIAALVELGARDLTVIANDTARPGRRHRPADHCRLRREGDRLAHRHQPGDPGADARRRRSRSSWCRRARSPSGCGPRGAGLGGVLTRTGLGTVVAEGKQVVTVEGRDYLLEPALGADVALIAARSADYMGNLVYSLTARNFNPLMALAAASVIAEPNEVVPVGVLSPDAIHTPGVIVDHLIERLQPA